jgi:hypothetical protein
MQALLGFGFLAVLAIAILSGLQAGGSVGQTTGIIITAVLTYLLTRFSERDRYQRELEAKIVSDKKLLYKSYLDIIRGYIDAKSNSRPSTEQLQAKFRGFFFHAMLNAEDEVLRAHRDYLDAPSEFNLPAFGDVIMAMRRDAGVTSSQLTSADVMQVLLGDIDDPSLYEEWERRKADGVPPSQPRAIPNDA